MKKAILLATISLSFITSWANAENYNEELIRQSWKGDLESVKSLFVDVNYKNDKGQTALYSAACQGNTDVVEFLIAAGATIDAEDNNKATPLMCSIWNKKSETAKYLLDKGADPKHKDAWGNSAESQLMHLFKKNS
jgi:ankyrin repeat protein